MYLSGGKTHFQYRSIDVGRPASKLDHDICWKPIQVPGIKESFAHCQLVSKSIPSLALEPYVFQIPANAEDKVKHPASGPNNYLILVPFIDSHCWISWTTACKSF